MHSNGARRQLWLRVILFVRLFFWSSCAASVLVLAARWSGKILFSVDVELLLAGLLGFIPIVCFAGVLASVFNNVFTFGLFYLFTGFAVCLEVVTVWWIAQGELRSGAQDVWNSLTPDEIATIGREFGCVVAEECVARFWRPVRAIGICFGVLCCLDIAFGAVTVVIGVRTCLSPPSFL